MCMLHKETIKKLCADLERFKLRPERPPAVTWYRPTCFYPTVKSLGNCKLRPAWQPVKPIVLTTFGSKGKRAFIN